MRRKTKGLGWAGAVVGVMALVAMACMCGGTSQPVEPPTLAQDAGTPNDLFQVPADIPVYAPNSNLLGTDESVGYESSAALEELVTFYEDEMPKNGWTQSVAPVATSGRTEMTYTKANRTAVIAVVDNGDQRTVGIGITK